MMNGMLYDASIDCIVLALFDSKKKNVAFRDTFSKPIKIEKGEYIARLQVKFY